MILLFGIVSTVAVVVLLLSLYRYASGESENTAALPAKQRTFSANDDSTARQGGWLRELATKKKPTYSYAVTEMEIDLPLKKKPEAQRFYRLLLKDLDGYKIFCIRQVLARNGIEYAMFRENRDGVLVVGDLRRPEVDRIVSLVRGYDVKIEIENYTKD
ncbi:hypothetical protein [Hydrogenimonas sp.]